MIAGLLENVSRLDAVELERDLEARLPAHFGADPKVRLHQADALQFDFCRLTAPQQRLRLGSKAAGAFGEVGRRCSGDHSRHCDRGRDERIVRVGRRCTARYPSRS